VSNETKDARELRELLAELRYSYGDASQDEQDTAADLIESQAQRNEELQEKNEQLEHNKAFFVREFLKALQCEECSATRNARLQASIAESVKGMSQDELDAIIADLEKPLSEDELLTDGEIENRKLKAELATLRATAEQREGLFVLYRELHSRTRCSVGCEICQTEGAISREALGATK